MLLKSEIEKAITDQKKLWQEKDAGIARTISARLVLRKQHILIITGIRRSGKSTLMLQLSKMQDENFAFFNFEDPRIFGFERDDFIKLNEALSKPRVYFFDEIQNIEGWEVFIRHLHDQQKVICITGSNASLLSRELGTRLTGRNIQVELFPFSFSEYMVFKKLEKNEDAFLGYLQEGGFPDYLSTSDDELLHQLFKDIIYRDIIVRHSVRNSKTLIDIALFLLSNVSREYSLNKLKKAFNLGSVNTVSDYIQWLEDSYLLFSVPRFSWSAKSVAVNPKKVYTIDTAFARANSLIYTKDSGRLFENAVYLQLRRQYKDIYYFREKGECDFVVKENQKIVYAMQSCLEVNRDNLKREQDGLIEALDFFDLKEGLIVTLNQEDEFRQNGRKIRLIPAWKWFSRE